MGIPSASVSQTPPAGDQANAVVQGTLAATGTIGPFMAQGEFNVAVWGTFSGTAVLEKSYDGGTTYIPVDFNSGTVAASFTAPVATTVREPEAGCLYILNCTTYTSGTMNLRMSTTGSRGTSFGPV